MKQALYVNGLERTRKGAPEKLLTASMGLRGIELTHTPVDWHSGASFDDLRSKLYSQVRERLAQRGRLAIVAASAGVSLSVGIFEQLRREDPSADIVLIGLSGWTQIHDMEQLQYTAQERPGKKPSPAFVESVIYCAEQAAPNLSDPDKLRIRMVYPSADEVVPLGAMGIPGVEAYTVRGKNHMAGIVLGALKTPVILNDIYANL